MSWRSLATAVLLGSLWSEALGQCLSPELLFGVTPYRSQYESICCKVPQRYAEESGFLEMPAVDLFGRLSRMEAAVRAGGSEEAAAVARIAGVERLGGVHIQMNGTTGAYEWVFYDSQCGLPLFIAPRGRSLEEFRQESLHHGWPSFRADEVVDGSLLQHADGEVTSACQPPTHLGHRFFDGKGARYCIDLMCIAGHAPGTPAAART